MLFEDVSWNSAWSEPLDPGLFTTLRYTASNSFLTLPTGCQKTIFLYGADIFNLYCDTDVIPRPYAPSVNLLPDEQQIGAREGLNPYPLGQAGS